MNKTYILSLVSDKESKTIAFVCDNCKAVADYVRNNVEKLYNPFFKFLTDNVECYLCEEYDPLCDICDNDLLKLLRKKIDYDTDKADKIKHIKMCLKKLDDDTLIDSLNLQRFPTHDTKESNAEYLSFSIVETISL